MYLHRYLGTCNPKWTDGFILLLRDAAAIVEPSREALESMVEVLRALLWPDARSHHISRLEDRGRRYHGGVSWGLVYALYLAEPH